MDVHTNVNVEWFVFNFMNYFIIYKYAYALEKYDKHETEMENYASSYS